MIRVRWIVFIVISTIMIFPAMALSEAKRNDEYVYEVKGKSVRIIQYTGKEKGTIIIPETIDGKNVTIIGENAFKNVEAEIVVLPAKISTIEGNAFAVTTIKEVIFPETKAKITIGQYAFNGCKNLEKIHFPGTVEFKKGVGSAIVPFAGVLNLKEITIDESSKDYEIIGQALVIKKNKTLIGYPFGLIEDIFIIPDGIKAIGDNALLGIEGKTIIIPDSVETIGSWAFAYSKFEDVVIGSGVRTIKYNAFASCPNLKTVTIAEGTTTIGEEAFWNSPKLESIVIPKSVKKIGKNAFGSNHSVKIITASNSVAWKYATKNGFAVEEPTE